MRLSSTTFFNELNACQAENGGYYGEDLKRIAEEHGIKVRTLRRNIKKWRSENSRFSALRDLGQRAIPLTLDDYEWIERKILTHPLTRTGELLNEINKNHCRDGRPAVGKSTFYSIVDRIKSKLAAVEKGLEWLQRKGVGVVSNYSVEDSRAALKTLFTFTNLKFHSGISLRALSERLEQAKKWFNTTYPDIDPLDWYPTVASRSKILRRQLSTIPADELQNVQGRLVFEAQVCFLVEGYDQFIDEIMMRRGRIQQSRNAARAALERDLLQEWTEQALSVLRKVMKDGLDNLDLEKIIHQGETLPEKARTKMLKKHSRRVDKLWNLLSEWTDEFSKTRLKCRGQAAALVLDLMREPAKWKELTFDEKRRISRDDDLISALDKHGLTLQRSVFLDRYLKYLKSGKIFDLCSWQYGDLGAWLGRFKHFTLEIVTTEDIKAFMAAEYPFPEISESSLEDDKDGFKLILNEDVPISHILDQVSRMAVRSNPNWFETHLEAFYQQSDGMFRMNYKVDEYRARLYNSIGFLGRNLRYSDSPAFRGLEYFIHRYLSDEALDIEIRHLWHIIRGMTGRPVNLILIDTMGINSRRKSFFAKMHGRYRTVGFSDLRAVATSLVPIYSTNCRSTDSEAMNIIPILAHAISLLGSDLQWYTGNGHTVSRLAAGMAFAAYRVIAAGRIHGEPKLPGPRCRKRLLNHCSLLNRVGSALRSNPSMGRLLASRHYYYTDGVNVRRLLEDLGSCVLWAQRQQGIKLDHLAQLIETSNRQKRVIRIVERGVTRVHEPNVSLVLKCAELLLCCMAVWRLNEGARRLQYVTNPVSLDGIVMFTPA